MPTKPDMGPFPAPSEDEPDWEYWGRTDACSVHDAALLSLNLSPDKFGPGRAYMPDAQLRDYTNRGALLIERWKLQCTDVDEPWFVREVDIHHSATFLIELGFDVPEPMQQLWRGQIEPAPDEPPLESVADRRLRRLARLRELGGDLRRTGTGWHTVGRRGALAALAREEAAAGRRMSDRSDVRDDLIAAVAAAS